MNKLILLNNIFTNITYLSFLDHTQIFHTIKCFPSRIKCLVLRTSLDIELQFKAELTKDYLTRIEVQLIQLQTTSPPSIY